MYRFSSTLDPSSPKSTSPEARRRVRSHSLEKAVFRRAGLMIYDQEGFIGERDNRLANDRCIHSVITDDRDRSIKGESTSEVRQTAQHRSLIVRQKVVAEVEGRDQGALPGFGSLAIGLQ